jgi:hypothetical protein
VKKLYLFLFLILTLFFFIIQLINNVLAITNPIEVLQKYEADYKQFKEIKIDNKSVYFQQRMIDGVIVEKNFKVYQFDENGNLLKKNIYWREDLPEHLPPTKIISKEKAESMVNGTIQFSKLYIISSDSDVFPIKPTPKNPSWVVRSIINNTVVITIIDAVTGNILGYGIPPPMYNAFSLTGPTGNYPCSGGWDAWYENAKDWFNTMGYNVETIKWPTKSEIQNHIQSDETALFYELAHGGSYSFANGCLDGNNYEITTANDIETWISGFKKMPFTFLGSCEGMCDTNDNTFSYEFRKGSMVDTATVGYCNMDKDYCDSCWIFSRNWQNEMFYYMNLGWTIKAAFDQANEDYPMCAASNCMRFAGDENFKVVPVVKRDPIFNTIPVLTYDSYQNIGGYKAEGIEADNNGNLYVPKPFGNAISIYDINKKEIFSIYGSGNGNYQFNRPSDIAVDSDGNIYVADYGNNRIQIYNKYGSYVKTIQKDWWEIFDPDLYYPIGVAVDSNKKVYVSSRNCVLIYNPDTSYFSKIGDCTQQGTDNNHFYQPHGIEIDSDGKIYIADMINNRIQIFDKNRNYLNTIGGTSGDSDYNFYFPYDVAIDYQNRIYVSDMTNNKIKIYSQNGNHLKTYDNAIDGLSIENPAGLGIDNVHKKIYIARYYTFQTIPIFKISESCSEGDRKCNGNWAQICENYQWNNKQYCSAGCDISNGYCIPFCGDGQINRLQEECEYPYTSNNVYCWQTTSECLGPKLGIRDNYGNCLSNCLCSYDSFNYYCSKSQCSAECDQNSDCQNKCVGNIRYYSGSCDITSTCTCSYLTENCDNKNGCYPYETGCEYRNHYCTPGGCNYTYSNRNLDYTDSFVNYCSDDTIKKHRQLHDFYCTSNCTDHVIWVDDQLVQDCNLQDGWYNTSNTKWVNNTQCTEKEQKQQEYRNYICNVTPNVNCSFSATNTTWIDTGIIKNKQNGTSCNDGLFCTVNDACIQGVCGGSPRDCSVNNLPEITRCDNNPDNYLSTFDYAPEFTSTCDDNLDKCTTGSYSFTHTCADIDNSDNVPIIGGILRVCSAECDQNTDCLNHCEGSILYFNSTCVSECKCHYQVQNCDGLDNWYDTGNIKWLDDTQCTEKKQKEQEYRDYSCSVSGCTYALNNTRWIITNETRNKQDDIKCDDGQWCTINDQCVSGACIGSLRDCSAVGNQCNLGVCNENNDQCVVELKSNGTSCNDGLFCTIDDQCNLGVCSGITRDCSDVYSCTDDSCNEDIDMCENIPNNDKCTLNETCKPDYFNETSTGCGNITQCTGKPDGTLCDDEIYCNGIDKCQNWICTNIGPSVNCSNLNDQCNVGQCNEASDKCEKNSVPKEGLTCDDGSFCNVGETCQSGICTGGNAKTCDDSIGCTVDSCDENNDRCVNVPNNAYCDNGLFCDGNEYCDVKLGCKNGNPIDCSGYNLPEIKTCNNNPDNNPFTWDYALGFTSTCDEVNDKCTQGYYSFVHACADNDLTDLVKVGSCNAPCDENLDCSERCNGKKWYSTYSCNLETCECDLSNLICTVGHCNAECDSNDDCSSGACFENCTCKTLLVEICSKTTTNCALSCKKCPTSDYEYCIYSYDSPCNDMLKKHGIQTSGTLEPGDSIPWLSCTLGGQCKLLGKPIITVTTTTTTTISGGPERICSKTTTNCALSCKKCPTEYNGKTVEHCEYSYDSSCNDMLKKHGIQTSGTLGPGDSIPWLPCTSGGQCTLDVYYLLAT